MEFAIEGLLRIKRVREESREAEMRRAKQQFEMAVEAFKRAQDSQTQSDRQRAERERALYDDVFARTVVVRELDDLKLELQSMRTAAKADAQAVTDARAQRQKRRETLDEMLAAWQLAARARSRFEDLATGIRELHAKQVEHLAELELEEYPARALFASAIEDTAEEI
jgi:hypothetical protein